MFLTTAVVDVAQSNLACGNKLKDPLKLSSHSLNFLLDMRHSTCTILPNMATKLICSILTGA